MKQTPPASSEIARRTMLANRSKNTGPERTLRSALWQVGLRGYRIHEGSLPGSPDIVFTRKKVAIFVHGCWWHGCPHCGRYRTPKANSDYWIEKLARNQARDREAVASLAELGFRVVIVWECQIGRSLEVVVKSVSEVLDKE